MAWIRQRPWMAWAIWLSPVFWLAVHGAFPKDMVSPMVHVLAVALGMWVSALGAPSALNSSLSDSDSGGHHELWLHWIRQAKRITALCLVWALCQTFLMAWWPTAWLAWWPYVLLPVVALWAWVRSGEEVNTVFAGLLFAWYVPWVAAALWAVVSLVGRQRTWGMLVASPQMAADGALEADRRPGRWGRQGLLAIWGARVGVALLAGGLQWFLDTERIEP